MRCGQHAPPISGDDTMAGKGALTELGCWYVDLITGFRGIATAKAIHIEGRSQTQLTPRSTPKSRFDASTPSVPAEWFEDGRLARLPMGKITII